MAKFCGKCGSALNSTAAFCGGCGAQVPPSPPAAPPATATAPSVQASYAPVAANFSSVPATTAPQQPASFAPVPPTFSPAPSAPAPPPGEYAPVQGNFAPVSPASAPAQTSYAHAPASYTPAPAAYTPGNTYPVAGAKKSNTLLKVIVAFVVIIFVGGAVTLGALWYAAQRIKEKAHAVATQALGGNPAAGNGLGQMLSGAAALKGGGSDGGFQGDPCRFLSKEEVSRVVGIQVIRAEAQDDGCSYIAHGDPADM